MNVEQTAVTTAANLAFLKVVVQSTTLLCTMVNLSVSLLQPFQARNPA